MVLFVSASGDYIGQGQTYATTDTNAFSFSGTVSGISVGAFGFGFTFVPGTGSLTLGTYANATRWPFNGGGPGIDISGNGRGCNNECGTFTILELHTNVSGQIDHCWITYSNSCECFMAPETGEIRYYSQLAPVATPKTIHVPGDYPTIQGGINAASLFTVDTVLVSPGTYNESVNFNGKRLVLTSTGGPSVTTIQVPSSSSGVIFHGGETSNAIVSGFTIAGASTGVDISSSSPTVVSNRIINCGTGINVNFSSPAVRFNEVSGCSGNGMYLNGAASPIVENNLVRTNHGAIYMWAAGSPTIRNNVLQGNIGDGMNLVNQSDANIVQNIIVANTGNGITWLTPSGTRGAYVINNTILKNSGAGISADGYDAGALIINNIILGAPAITVGTFNDNNPPVVQYNDIFGVGGAAYAGAISNLTGVAGNISSDPLFTCDLTGDYHLLASSPALDAGTNTAPQVASADLDGNARVQPHLTNGVPRIDLGAYEFNPSNPPTPCIYVTCPPNMVVAAAAGQTSAVVNFPAPTGPPVATLSSSPPSGSVFAGGTNVVTCSAVYGNISNYCTFTITVLLPPILSATPLSTNVPAGQSFSLSVAPSGTTPFTYQWRFENTLISGATSSTLTISNAQVANEGIYRAIVANGAGTATGAVMSVRVTPTPPTILSNPASITVGASSNATFRVTAIGSQPLSYQWYFNNSPIAGATQTQYALASAQATNNGNYTVLVANSMGTATSAVATLSVIARPPYFTLQPVSSQVSAGSSKTLTGLADGSQPITYQWQHAGTNLPGATQTSLTLTNLSADQSGIYTLLANNAAGTTPSSNATLTIFQLPTLMTPLTNQVVDVSNDVTLAVTALGSQPLVYSWQFNGQPILATNLSLTLSNIQMLQSGFYRLMVSNQYGATSSVARVSVLGPVGTIVSWGDNSGGQTNVPTSLGSVVAIAGGDYHSIALRHDGTIAAWGYNGDGQTSPPTNVVRFVSIGSGANHNLAITASGSVAAWGRNDLGQCNVPPNATNGVLAVAAGDSHSLALLSNGVVVAWGDNSYGQISIPQGLNGVRAIAAGRLHSLALRTNGTVIAWGYNSFGQATVPAGLANVAAITAGYLHSVAILSNGTAVVWGDNTFGQTNAANGTNLTTAAAGDFHTIGLRTDGTITTWGDNTYGQRNVPSGLANIVSIASGNYHALALVAAPGLLQASMVNSQLVLQWKGVGILQSSPSPQGPYTDVPCLGTCYTNIANPVPSLFFRLRR